MYMHRKRGRWISSRGRSFRRRRRRQRFCTQGSLLGSSAEIHCPPKGDPKRGIRPTDHLNTCICLSHFWVTSKYPFVRTPFLDPPFGGRWEIETAQGGLGEKLKQHSEEDMHRSRRVDSNAWQGSSIDSISTWATVSQSTVICYIYIYIYITYW